jgi:hypothetical protein
VKDRKWKWRSSVKEMEGRREECAFCRWKKEHFNVEGMEDILYKRAGIDRRQISDQNLVSVFSVLKHFQ